MSKDQKNYQTSAQGGRRLKQQTATQREERPARTGTAVQDKPASPRRSAAAGQTGSRVPSFLKQFADGVNRSLSRIRHRFHMIVRE